MRLVPPALFKKYLGNTIYIAIALNALSTIFETFGIMVLYPISLELINTNRGSLPEQTNTLVQVLKATLGIVKLEYNIKNLIFFGFFLFILKGVFVFIFMAYQARLRGVFLTRLKRDLFQNYISLPIQSQQKYSIGETINIFNEQATRAVEALQAIIIMFASFISFLIYTSIALSVSTTFTVTFFCCAIVVAMLFMRLNKKVRALSKSTSELSSDTATSITDLIIGFKYLYATGRLSYVSNRIEKQISYLGKNEVFTGILSAVVQAAKEPVALVLILVSSVASIWLFEQSISEIIVCVLLIYKSSNLLFLTQTNLLNYERYFGSVNKISNFIANLDDNSFKGKKSKAQSSDQTEILKVEKIEFTDINHFYEPNCLLFQSNIKARFDTGKIYGLIGPSGSGKSTILDILLGCITPTSGSVYVNNLELGQLNQEALAQRVSYCSQDGVIFKDTVINNILLPETGKSELLVSEQKVRRILVSLGLKSYLDSLPLGLNSMLGERGVNLSGGQRQRILLARELLRESDILILDEVTSALDVETSLQVMDYIKDTCHNRIVIMVTHNRNNLSFCDCVYHIKDKNLGILKI
ncbi:ABC transporter ATP-binding protein/permease [Planktomarina sp.]|nr:ABC transporter ATP-binding protein/permease [Planktomarina sp.]